MLVNAYKAIIITIFIQKFNGKTKSLHLDGVSRKPFTLYIHTHTHT